MADETPESRIPAFLPLSEETSMARMMTPVVKAVTEALQPILFNKPVPYPWTVKSVMVEIERDGRRYEVIFVGERWAHAKLDKKPSKEFLDNLRKQYDTLDAKGKEANDQLFQAISGSTLPELLEETEIDGEARAESIAGDEPSQ